MWLLSDSWQKKWLICVIVFVMTSGFLRAGTREVKNSRISILGGVYFMQDDVFKQVYGDYAWVVSGGYSYRLPFLLKNHLEVGLDYRFLSDRGKLTVTKEAVDLMISDVSLTLKYLFDLNKIILYLGPGVQYIMYKETYPPAFPVSSVNGSVWGFSFQGGCYYDLTSFLGIKLCIQYNQAEAEEGSVKANIGGIGLRAGLVYRFDL